MTRAVGSLGWASVALTGALALGIACAAPPARAEIEKREFTVVGTPGNLYHWKLHESKLFQEMIPAASGGKLTANAKPRDELGLSGFELMRQLKLGAFDFVYGDFTYVAGDAPALEGVDLSGVAQSIEQYREMHKVYRPVFDRVIGERFESKILLTYAWPSQQLWCNLGDRTKKDISLKTLAGKKIRTFSAPQADFVRGLGGSTVTLGFQEVLPALEKGVVDCGLTGTLPAYEAKWWQVVTHNIRVRLGYIGSFLAVHNKVWASLSPEARKVIETEAAKVEAMMWLATAKNDQIGQDCNAQGPCAIGEPGNMTAIEPSAEDKAAVKRIVSEQVLKGWAKRCGDACIADWNKTVGKLVGLEAKM
jgi:TRAP-type C4-dicarboxylate transport system substrate-binding protein